MALEFLVDTYATRDFVDEYHASLGNTEWAAVEDDQRDIYIRRATLYLDRSYRYVGRRAAQFQPLSWPRTLATDLDGYAVATDDTPLRIKRATAIVADQYRLGISLDPVITNDDSAIEEIKVDVLEVKYRTEDRQKTSLVTLPLVDDLVYPYVVGNVLRRA